MVKILVVISLLFFCGFQSLGQITAEIGKSSYPFLLSLPEKSDSAAKQPLLIFLHGRSLSGTNLQKVRQYGVIHELDKGRKVPMFVVAPQVKAGESWSPDKLNELLDYMLANYNVDSSRIYVAGMSLGGYGTLHFAGKYAGRIAAAAAFCGGGNVQDACSLATLPLWIVHGTSDKAVPFSESKKMVTAIKNCKGENQLTFTVMKGGNHGAPEKYFRTDEFYDWLLSHKK
ncbi:MAG: prolyl oligopeptidase family serine peptidase [Crocinitomicaceae bacterium]